MDFKDSVEGGIEQGQGERVLTGEKLEVEIHDIFKIKAIDSPYVLKSYAEWARQWQG